MQVGPDLAKLEHKRSGKLLALVGGDWFIRQRGLGFALGCRQRGQAKDRAAQLTRDGVSVLVFSVGQHNDREVVSRKVIQAAAVSHERSMLANAAMIVLMAQDHGESVLRFGVLR